MSYKFNQLGDVTKAIILLKKEKKGKIVHYPVLFKKALMDYAAKHDISSEKLAAKIEIGKSTLYNWQKQYSDGLFTMEGAYNVSTKSKALNAAILVDLEQQLVDLTEKIRVVEAAEKMGLKIVA